MLWFWFLHLFAIQLQIYAIDLGSDGSTVKVEHCEKDNGCADSDKQQRELLHPDWVHVGVVACGDRQPETVVAVKAIMVTSSPNVFIHVFTEDELMASFHSDFASWPNEIRSKFKYRLYRITYPPDRFQEWKKLFKTCATQRLFIPTLLAEVDSILYIDTDILLMRPVQDVWDHFKHFNSSQLAAVAPEHESASAGWYNRFARHPYYGRLGINSGVMLMNMTRIRAFTWLEHMNDYLTRYKYNITWGDQDLLNILFHHYPEFVYIYECNWNYRPDHCMYMSVCKVAEQDGISVLHGNRGVLHNDKHPQFKAIYDAFEEYKFDGLDMLLRSMEAKLDALDGTEGRCQAVKDLFCKRFRLFAH
ncbi:glucoside xylosyltransferase 2-like [Watersipora subatra]|uniref:glucoside xylosyltransferase 2-like n=1 Tax=Watersipora subatra TaxID=2589382 RepID=UPI00355C1E82